VNSTSHRTPHSGTFREARPRANLSTRRTLSSSDPFTPSNNVNDMDREFYGIVCLMDQQDGSASERSGINL